MPKSFATWSNTVSSTNKARDRRHGGYLLYRDNGDCSRPAMPHYQTHFVAAALLFFPSLTFADQSALSPTGKFVALQDRAGDVWLFEPHSAASKKLLLHAHADPVSFAWSPLENALLVTRPDRILQYQIPSGKLHSSSPGSSPQFSPNGHSWSAIRNHNLWLAANNAKSFKPLASSNSAAIWTAEPEPVFAHEFNPGSHYWWAPDSTSIAYLETDFRHAAPYPLPGAPLPIFRLKIVSVPSGASQTITESSDAWPYILRVTFLPDSHRLAFYRLNRLQNKAELCLWENGAPRTILSETDAYWINAPATPLFLQDRNHFVITSERSGHRHAYLYNLDDGTLIRDLTPPDLEIAQLLPALSQDAIFVTGSTGNHQEQHFFRLNPDTGASTQITTEPGWHEVSINPSGAVYIDNYSSSLKPPSISWHTIDGTQHQQITEPNTTGQPVANDYLPIKTHDSVLLPARLYKPADFDPNKKYPIILYTFSGPNGRVVSDSWGGWQMAWNRSMVRRGFLVLAVDVRGSGGYSHLFEEYIHYRFGAQENADLREVVSFLRIQTYVDPHRIGIWGCAYGAHTVVHAMFEFPHGFAAGFADSPITDWHQYNAYFTERYLGLPARHVTEYDDSSALENAKRLTGHLLVAAYPNDPIILPAQLAALQDAVLEVKQGALAKQFQVFTPATGNARASLLQAMTDFFEHNL